MEYSVVFGLAIALGAALNLYLTRLSDRLDKVSGDKSEEIKSIIREIIRDHKRILYNGNNYSDEWRAEAKRRNLIDLPATVDAIEALKRKENIELLTKHGILSETEIESRYEINLEMYSKVINIEALTMLTMAERSIIPAVEAYCGGLGRDINSAEGSGGVMTSSRERLLCVSENLNLATKAMKELKAVHSRANIKDFAQKARYFKNEVIPAMQTLRDYCDKLETMLPKDAWPFPDYTDLMSALHIHIG